jgi:hypothetical protein
MNTKRLLLSVTLLLSINVCIVLYLLNGSSSYNIKITNKYHVIYNNNFDFAVSPSSHASPSTNSPSFELHLTKDSMTPTFMDKISIETSTDKISTETSTDKISIETSTDKISIETSTDKISTETSTDKISTETSTDKISTETSTDKISTETNKNLMETENQLLLDYDYNKKNETGLPYIFERMFTFFIYSL